MELDYQQIYDGITLALHAAFPSIRIFGENIQQGLTPGDINVIPVNTEENAQIGTRARRDAVFDVIYYPPDDGKYEACLEMQHLIPQALQTITTPNGDKLHCLRFSGTTDDVLHVIVSYPHFVYVPAAKDVMEQLTIQ